MFHINFFKNKDYWVYGAIVALATVWMWVQWTQYHNFGYSVGDTAVAEQAMWNTAHGAKFFHQSALQIEGSNFREHLNFSRFIFLPFYWLIPHTLTLFAVINVFFVFGAITLYRYARSRHSFCVSLIAVGIFITHPLVSSQVGGAMHVVAIGGSLIILLLIAYEQKKYRNFLFWLTSLALLSEFVAPTVFLIGVVALLDGRNWKWYFPAWLYGIAMYFASRFYIAIGFGAGDYALNQIQSLPHIDHFDKRAEFVINFLKPIGIVGIIFSRYAILLFPSILIALVISQESRLSGGQHVFVLVPGILSFIFLDVMQRQSQKLKLMMVIISVIGVISVIGSSVDLLDPDQSSEVEYMREAVTYVKDGGSVTSSSIFGPWLNKRSEYYLSVNEKFSDYIVIKQSKHRKSKVEKARQRGEILKANFLEKALASGNYLEIYQEGRVHVLVKKSKASELLDLSLQEIDRIDTSVIIRRWKML